MKRQFLILGLFLVLLSGIGIVSAETLTGTLGGIATNQSQINNTAGSLGYNAGVKEVYITNIQYATGTVSMVHFDGPGKKGTFSAGSPVGDTGTFTMRATSVSGNIVAHGTAGYQRNFNIGGTEIEGYQYLVFDQWLLNNVTTGSAYYYVVLDNPLSTVYNMSLGAQDVAGHYGGDGDIVFAGHTGGNAEVSGITLRTIQETATAVYTLVKPSGLGIQGNVVKSGLSRIYILNGTSPYATITNDNTPNINNLSVNTNAQTIIVCLLTPGGHWFNSSVLFTSGTGMPTPTPTPTPTVTLLPGQFWTTFAAQDATTGGLIPGAEIDIYSRFKGTWDNATSSTGERIIATSSNNYYDVYGSASGYSNGSLINVMAYNNAYYLVNLFPTTGLPSVPGQVNLFVSVTERETGLPISGASVSVATPGSWTVQGETDNKGIEIFSTSNSSVKYITVSKTGYKKETRTITTPASGNYNAVLQMSRIVVTTVPTGYIPPGSVTPVTTMDSRSTTEKDQDMMNMIRDSGPNLIQLAIAVTMISLLGLMAKGFGK